MSAKAFVHCYSYRTALPKKLFTEQHLKLFVLQIVLCIWLVACGGESSDSSSAPSQAPTPTLTPTSTPVPTQVPTTAPSAVGSDIVISGYITFDLVPHSSLGALEYSNATAEPARSVNVVLMNADNEIIRQTKTDQNGYYRLGSPVETYVRIVAQSKMEQSEGAIWSFDVIDNTAEGALYVLAGELQNSGLSDGERNLHAPSGWNTSTQSFDDIAVRPAAPFAILHAAYQTVEKIVEADALVEMPPCHFNWSYLNKAVEGDIAEGFVSTAYYDLANRNIFLLGEAYNDTDEYDFSVIQHELGHFIEDVLSRSDSIGGSHSLADMLDMRVAFSEGFANAFTGLVSGQPKYMDSIGRSRLSSFTFSVEDNYYGNQGWYSENSIGKILYDIGDSTNEYGDELSLGFEAIYDVMVDQRFIKNDALSSIFLFSEIFTSLTSSEVDGAYKALLEDQEIYSAQRFGEDELNSGGNADFLPVYHSLVRGGAVEVCSTNEIAAYNGLGVSQFIRIDIDDPGTTRISIKQKAGSLEQANPDARLFYRGAYVGNLNSEVMGSEVESFNLSAGTYVLEVFDVFNTDFAVFTTDEDADVREKSCFDVQVI